MFNTALHRIHTLFGMTDMTEHVLTGTFDITAWDETVYDAPESSPPMARATVSKAFHGDLEGTSVAEVLTAGSAEGRGYVASERFSGTINGRAGTIVFQHGGIDDGTSEPFTFGRIVAGTGTAGLAGLSGDVTYAHDEQGARVTLRIRAGS